MYPNIKKVYGQVLNIYLVNGQDMMKSGSCAYVGGGEMSLNDKKARPVSIMPLGAHFFIQFHVLCSDF